MMSLQVDYILFQNFEQVVAFWGVALIALILGLFVYSILFNFFFYLIIRITGKTPIKELESFYMDGKAFKLINLGLFTSKIYDVKTGQICILTNYSFYKKEVWFNFNEIEGREHSG